MVPLLRRWSNGVEEDDGDALKGRDLLAAAASTLLRYLLAAAPSTPLLFSAANPRLDRTRRAIVAGRDELDAILFLFFGQAASLVAAAEAESTILLHDLLAVGGVGSGLM